MLWKAFLESTSVLIIIIFVRKATSQLFWGSNYCLLSCTTTQNLLILCTQTANKGKIPLTRKVGFQRLPIQNRLEKSMWFYNLFLKSGSVFIANFLTFVLLGRMHIFFFNSTMDANKMTRNLLMKPVFKFFKREACYFFSRWVTQIKLGNLCKR